MAGEVCDGKGNDVDPSTGDIVACAFCDNGKTDGESSSVCALCDEEKYEDDAFCNGDHCDKQEHEHSKNIVCEACIILANQSPELTHDDDACEREYEN